MRKDCHNIFPISQNYLFVLVIIGLVIGAVVLLILIAVVITTVLVLYFEKKKQKKKSVESIEMKKDP